MRLLLCIPYFAPAYAFGGSVTVAETIVEGFVEAGHEVTVATTDVLDERHRVAPGTPGVPGAEVVRFRNVSHRAAARANVYLPRGYRRWLRENVGRFDVVLLQDVYSAVSVGAARAAHAARVPYALQPLGTLSPAAERGRPMAKRLFLGAFGDRTLSEASALLHATQFERQDFLDAGAEEAKLVAMPLPLDLPEPSGAQKAPVPTVVSVGRLHPIKRLALLIEAISIARRSIPALRLDIVGPGEAHERELRELAERLDVADATTFHGYVSVKEKFAIIERSDVGALLSASEGLPMAALEYMACGLPVILSEGCHLPEVDSNAGLVVEGTAEAAAAALVRLLNDQDLRTDFSTAALAFARKFRREVVIPNMVSALAAASRRTSPPRARYPRRSAARSFVKKTAVAAVAISAGSIPTVRRRLVTNVDMPNLDPGLTYAPDAPYFDYADWPLLTDSPSVPTDIRGIPRLRIPGSEPRWAYNPVTIAQLGLQLDGRARATGNRAASQEALDLALFLASRQDRTTGAWTYDFDQPVAGTACILRAPWVSAMAQGQALSLLTRTYRSHRRPELLAAAANALEPFRHSVADGGVVATLLGNPFYEEYPTTPPNFTLNGFMFSLLGLYDLANARCAEAAEALSAFATGMNTLEACIGLFETGGISAYHLWHVGHPRWPAHRSLFYHWVHVQLLTGLMSAAPSEILRSYRDRWLVYEPRIGDPR